MAHAQWEAQHGQPRGTGTLLNYEGGKYVVVWSEGLAYNITQTIGEGARAIPVADARVISQQLLPADAQLIRSVNQGERQVDFYQSAALKSRFPLGAPNGECLVILRTFAANAGRVSHIIVGVGDNP